MLNFYPEYVWFKHVNRDTPVAASGLPYTMYFCNREFENLTLKNGEDR